MLIRQTLLFTNNSKIEKSSGVPPWFGCPLSQAYSLPDGVTPHLSWGGAPSFVVTDLWSVWAAKSIMKQGNRFGIGSAAPPC